jgi:hypothetical protein
MEDYAKKILYNYNDKSGSLNIKWEYPQTTLGIHLLGDM